MKEQVTKMEKDVSESQQISAMKQQIADMEKKLAASRQEAAKAAQTPPPSSSAVGTPGATPPVTTAQQAAPPPPEYVVEEVDARLAPEGGALRGRIKVRVRSLTKVRTWAPLFSGDVGVVSAQASGGGLCGSGPLPMRSGDTIGLMLPAGLGIVASGR